MRSSRKIRIEVMATAQDPFVAAERMRAEVPDVIRLEMPRMDGLTFLDEIVTQHPIPVVVCSSLTETCRRDFAANAVMFLG